MLLVFDLDGTLVDSRRDIAASANDTLVALGAGPLDDEQIARFVGDGARLLVARALKAAGLPAGHLGRALETFLEIYNRRLLDTTRPYEGMADVLSRGAELGAAMGVITNKPQAPSERIIDAFGMSPSFRWIVGGDTAFARKPDPTSLRWMIGEARADPASTLFVGDTQIDADTARAAGTRFCLAAYGFGQLRGRTALLAGEHAAGRARDIIDVMESLAS